LLGILDNEPITSVRSFSGLLLEGVEIVTDATGATVIFLRDHPAWAAAQRHERERSEAMHRHPSFLARKRAASRGSVVRHFKVYSSTDTPA
jgi:hypothetical protein